MQQRLKTLRGWSRQGHAIVIDCGVESLRISCVHPGTLRLVLQRHPYQSGTRALKAPESVLLHDELKLHAAGPQRGPITIRSGSLRLTIDGPGAQLRLGCGATLTPCWDGMRVGLIGTLAAGEHIYGLGEPDQNGPPLALDRRGAVYDLFNSHQPRPSRLALPVFYSSLGYGVLVDNSWIGRIDMGATGPDRWLYEAGGGDLDFYLLGSADARRGRRREDRPVQGSLPDMVESFTALTGRPALPPQWTLGFMQSKFGYRNRAELEAVAAEFRRRGIPCDSLVLDLYWFRRMGDLCFDERAFPDPGGMLRGLREQGFKVITIEEPYITRGSRLFQEGRRKGCFARFPDGRLTFPFWFGDDEAALVDFTNPAACEWWIRQHEALVVLGVAGWWLDLNEPEQHYSDLLHHGGPAAAVHNRFALRHIATVAEAQHRYAPDRRCFMMSRSGWLGMAHYGATTWSGDISSSFPSLAQQPALALGMGLAGVPGWNSDVGGFQPPDGAPAAAGPGAPAAGDLLPPELYVRWLQFAAFSPLARPHAALQPREPWAFGAEAEAIAGRYIGLRQRLIPYAYTALREACTRGAPLLRPLVWAYPDDPQVADMADEYLYGPDLLVAPVLEAGAQERRVYLPAGQWYDFENREPLPGGQWHTVAAPLGRLPLFVRAGAVVPLAPLQQYVGEHPLDELTLTIWPGAAGARYELYEDDGETEAYREGVYATTTIRVAADATAVHIGRCQGPFAPQVPRRSWRLEVARPGPPLGVQAGRRALPQAPSADALAGLAAGWHYDARQRTLHVKLAPSRQALQVQIEGESAVRESALSLAASQRS